MPDNTSFHASLDPAMPRIADREVSHSGDSAKVQLISLVEVIGAEGSATVRELSALDTILNKLLGIIAAASSVASGPQTADVQMVGATASLRLMGFSAVECAGTAAPAEFVLRHGTSAAGAPLVQVNLGPDESVRDWFGPGGIAAASGIYFDRISGTIDLCVQYVVAP